MEKTILDALNFDNIARIAKRFKWGINPICNSKLKITL
jgi:hypothetical protein